MKLRYNYFFQVSQKHFGDLSPEKSAGYVVPVGLGQCFSSYGRTLGRYMALFLLSFCIVFFEEISWSCCAGWVGTSSYVGSVLGTRLGNRSRCPSSRLNIGFVLGSLSIIVFFCIVFVREISWSCCAERWVGTRLGNRSRCPSSLGAHRERTRVSTARAAERVGPWGCGRVFHNSLVRKWETETLYLKGTRTCDSLRLATPLLQVIKSFQNFPRFSLIQKWPLKFDTCENERSFQVRKGVMAGWSQNRSDVHFSDQKQPIFQLLRINSSSEKIMKLTACLYQTVKPCGSIFGCQLIWPLVNILLRLHHLLIGFYHVEEKQSSRSFCAQLFTSVVKNQFQVCSQSNISPHFFIWGTFCANLLLSIVPQLFGLKNWIQQNIVD